MENNHYFFTEDITKGAEKVAISCVNNVDNERIPDFKYIRDNELQEDVKENMNLIFIGCSCETECHSDKCYCLLDAIGNYDSMGNLLKENKISDRQSHPIFECNACCQCDKDCGNRLVQHGIRSPLQVYKTTRKGWAVKTLTDVCSRSYVADYVGEVISVVEAKSRIKDCTCTGANYIIAVKEDFGGSEQVTYVDATHKGNAARFINHSCTPNLEIYPVRIDSTVPRLALFACKDIHKNEELTFDYAGGTRNYHRDVEKTVAQKGGICYCLSKNCQGFLPFDEFIFDT